jgi:cyclophilin family peptidyl-prolyl cis-trans isomerase
MEEMMHRTRLFFVVAISLAGCAATGPARRTASGGPLPQVVFETSMGAIVAELYEQEAPLATQNVLAYVDAGFYDGTIFHRVISDFMIQGGGLTADLAKKETRAPILNEATNRLRNRRGTLAMARTGVVDSATSQFFVNVVDNRMLDHRSMSPEGFGYAVFGRVIEGMDVVDRIRAVDTCPQAGADLCTQALPPGMQDVPAVPVVITRAFRRAP